jgi:hypothetical protein
MHTQEKPSVVLICHEQDPLDVAGLASWLASSLRLAGLIIIRDPRSRLWRAAKREIKRVGWLRFLDVAAFRVYARLRLAGRDEAWKASQDLARERGPFPRWPGSAWATSHPYFAAGVPMRNAMVTTVAPTGNIDADRTAATTS